MLKVIKDPEPQKGFLFRDANDILSSFPRAEHETREPTEEEINKRQKYGWHNKTKKK